MTQSKYVFLAIIAVLLAGIWTTLSHYKKHSDSISFQGNVDVRQVDLGFRASGKLMKVDFQEGDLVKKGDLMAVLDKQPYLDRVAEANARVESIGFSLASAEDLLQRRTKLLGGLGISKEDYDNALSKRNQFAADLRQAQASLASAETDLKDTDLFAPENGMVLTRVREPGTVLKEGEPVYTLSLINPAWIRIFLKEPELGLIHPNMQVKITYQGIKKGQFNLGNIGFISPSPEFTPKTVQTTSLRTDLVYRVRVVVDNSNDELKQGMPVEVTLF